MRDELNKFPSCVPSLPFGDVRRNRNRATSHLRDESKPLGRRKTFGDYVNLLCQRNALLPHQQIAIIARLLLVTHHLSLITHDSSLVSQRDHRIHSRGATGWDVTSRHGD